MCVSEPMDITEVPKTDEIEFYAMLKTVVYKLLSSFLISAHYLLQHT